MCQPPEDDDQRIPPSSLPHIDPGVAAPTGYETDRRAFSFPRSPGMPRDDFLLPNYDLGVSLHQESDITQSDSNTHDLENFLGERPQQRGHTGPQPRDITAWFDFQLDPLQLDLYGWDTLLGCDTEPELGSPGISLDASAPQGSERTQTNVLSIYSGEENSSRTFVGSSGGPLPSYDQVQQNGQDGPKHVENKEYWPGVLDQGGNETWPFDYTSNKGFRRIKLPPLKEVLEQTVACRPSIQKSILGDLIKVLSGPQIPSLNDTPALEAMPAVAFLGEFTRVYFAEFHNFCPVIHTPTWRIEKCPTPLLAAMACIGATYSSAEGSSELSALFAEITQRALFWTVSTACIPHHDETTELIRVLFGRVNKIAPPSATPPTSPPLASTRSMLWVRGIDACTR